MNGFLEKKPIQMIVFIKRACISLKFPCSLKATITADNDSQSGDPHQLTNGEAVFNDTIKIKMQAYLNNVRGVYDEKKIMISLYLVLTNKASFIGEAQFSLFGKNPHKSYETILYLDKCPQKNSKIYFSFSTQILKLKQNTSSFKNLSANNSSKLSPFKEAYSSLRINQSPKHNEKQRMETTTHFKKESAKNKLQNKESVEESIAERNRSIKIYKSLQKIKSKQALQDRKKVVNQTNQSNLKGYKSLTKISSQKQINQQSTSNISLIYKDTTQKLNLSTSIQSQQRLRSQQKIKSHQRINSQQQMFDNSKEIIAKNNQLLLLQDDVNQVKKRLKEVEKQAKQIQKKLKRSNEENQKKNTKIQNLVLIKDQLQKTIKSKEQRIKKLQSTNNALNEQLQSLNSLLKSQKLQFSQRGQAFKDQMLKSQDKNKLSQLQRQQAIQQLNVTLNRMEQNQQKYQAMLKEKDKIFTEERYKYSKKIQQISSTLEDFQQQIQQNKICIQKMTKEKNILLNRIEGLQAEFKNIKEELQQSSLRCKQQAELIHFYEGQIQRLKAEDNEKQKLKKKIMQMNSLEQATSQKIMKYEQIILKFQNQLKEYQANLDQTTRDKQRLQQKVQTISKEVEVMKDLSHTSNKQLQIMNNLQMTLNSKNTELRQRLQSQKRHRSQMQKQFNSKVTKLQRQLQHKISQLDESNWEIYRLQNRIDELSNNFTALNDQMIKISEELFISEQKCRKLMQEQQHQRTTRVQQMSK